MATGFSNPAATPTQNGLFNIRHLTNKIRGAKATPDIQTKTAEALERIANAGNVLNGDVQSLQDQINNININVVVSTDGIILYGD